MEPAVPCGAGPFGGPRGLAVGAAPPVGRLQLGGLRRRRPSEIRQKLAAGGWVSGYVTRCVASSSLLEQLHFSLLAVSVITRSPSFTRIQACAVVVDGDVMSLYGCISFFIPSSPRVVVPQFYDVNNNEVQPIRRCPQTCTDRIALTTTPFHPLLGLSDCLQPSNVFC